MLDDDPRSWVFLLYKIKPRLHTPISVAIVLQDKSAFTYWLVGYFSPSSCILKHFLTCIHDIIIVLVDRGRQMLQHKNGDCYFTLVNFHTRYRRLSKTIYPYKKTGNALATFKLALNGNVTRKSWCVKTRLHDATKICTKITLCCTAYIKIINGLIFATIVWCTCRKKVEKFQLSTEHSHVPQKTLTFCDFVACPMFWS